MSRKSLSYIILWMLTMLLLTGCSEKVVNDRNDREAQIHVSADLADIGDVKQLDRFILTISARDMKTIGVRLDLVRGYLEATVKVPVGPQRRFVVEALDVNGTVIYRGETVSDVDAAKEMVIEISLFPVVPLLKLSPLYPSVPENFYFGLSLKAYNIVNLNTIGFQIYDDQPYLTSASGQLDNSLSGIATLTILDLYPPGFSVSATDPSGLIVDDSGYVTLATIYYLSDTVINEVDTARCFIDPISLTDAAGNQMPIPEIVVESSHVEIYKPAYYAVGYWPMEVDTIIPDAIYDISGNELHGTAFGTSYDIGPRGTARYFDGIDDYIEIPDDALLDIADEITIAFWILIDAQTGTGAIISKGDSDRGFNYHMDFTTSAVSADVTFSFVFGPPPVHTYQTTAPINNNEWHHVTLAFKYGRPSSAQWLIDGQAVDGFWSGGDGTARPIENDNALQVGRGVDGTGGYLFGGLDEVLISDVYLYDPRIKTAQPQ
ncbi:MAG: LamG domain-containing protein [Candidatus Zixiibacteriota bacterium]|nr:MAG: LamG domain-containing protein [candidate division Zixibacteria bacterium]